MVLVALALGASMPGMAAANWREAPIVPEVSPAMETHLRAIARRGAGAGNRPGVVAKVGDSITESNAFLTEMACQSPRFGKFSRLEGTWRFFGQTRLPDGYGTPECEVSDSYSRRSVAAVAGWMASDANHPLQSPPPGCEGLAAVECELRLLKPAFAVVMFGTNDVEEVGTQAFRRNLADAVAKIERAGTIPIVSTIPPRKGPFTLKTERFNREIAGLAKNRKLPLWNYWRQMAAPDVPSAGLSRDGVHPSVCRSCTSIDFTPRGLQQGYALRNLGALLALERVRHRVFSP